jgi:aminomethyltransferase
MSDTSVDLQNTPLHARHVASGARMVPFAGWDMPVEYSGISAEHLAVRTAAGLFDVSHMGQFEIAGPGGLELVQQVSCNNAAKLELGQAQYSGLLTDEGTFLDDLIVYRMAASHFVLVVNAANRARDLSWITDQNERMGDRAAVVDSSSRYAMLALQGPSSESVLQPLTGADLSDVTYYSFTFGEVASARAMILRTGYTGEDGFEILVPPNTADTVWQAILQSGAAAGVVPCGLGARDTLRLEAGMRLHGQDIDDTTTPLEAGLGWTIGWEKETGNGLDILRAQKASGVERKLVGFEMVDRGIARHGCPVVLDGTPVGTVTSGTQTPFLKKAIGMAYVPTGMATPDQTLTIAVRERLLGARVVRLPFYQRTK